MFLFQSQTSYERILKSDENFSSPSYDVESLIIRLEEEQQK